ncbi:MAG: ABC transporter ATP-binding protein, partial [Clostridia bacterium]|nr:ABC transporter ATP-binding protein [Clostridia bacterium]
KKLLDKDTPEDFRIVRECLEKVNMLGLSDRKFSTLSGGEKQRVLLARALAQETSVLVLDEPTNHLDIKYQLQTMEIIRNLNKGVLLALHDLNMAFRYCDYVFIMKDGRVEAHGKPEDIIDEALIRNVYEVESRIYENPVTHLPSIAFLP